MTDQTYTIGELAERTGATVRALRIYESYGLIAPHRGVNGRRLFDDSDLKRVRHVAALKRIGLTLAQIGPVLDSKVGIGRLVSNQLEALEGHWRKLAVSISNLRAAKHHIDTGRHIELEQLCEIIERAAKDAPIVAKYYNNEQLQRLMDREPSPQQQRILSAAWESLFETVETLAAKDAAPSSPEARAAAQLWSDLLHQFTHGNQDIANILQRQAEDSYESPADGQAAPGSLSKEGWLFISRARAAAQL